MQISPHQLAEFRHRVRSELNQILGYAELLSIDQAADMPDSSIAILNDLQTSARCILHTSQILSVGDNLDEAIMRGRARDAMGSMLDNIERQIAALLDELPSLFLADLQRIQSAFLSLRTLLDRPIRESVKLKRSPVASIDLLEFYSAVVPQQLSIEGRLLVVDDSEANRQLLERQLTDLGLHVEAVDSGEAALEALARAPFDCVLVDMMMPGMNGPAVLTAIRENATWSNIQVVMLSAFDEVGQAANCIELGAADYLIRPIERSILRAKIYSTIQRKYLYESCQKLGREVEASNEELKRFMMVASHDLQAPLRTLEANLSTIFESEQLSEAARLLVNDCTSRCQRMSSIVQDLLLYARLGQVEPFVETIELNWVLSEAMANLQGAIGASGAEIRLSPLPRINADFKQMLYLFQNLLANAIKYAGKPAPQISVEAEEREDSHLIAVRDSGVGIEEGQWHRIFEPFHRLHGDAIPGSGLGLAIAKRTVEQAGGKIWVNSLPGSGSTFYLSLPKL